MGYGANVKTLKKLRNGTCSCSCSCRVWANHTENGEQVFKWAKTVHGPDKRTAKFNAELAAKNAYEGATGKRTDLAFWIDREIERMVDEKISDAKQYGRWAEWIKAEYGERCVIDDFKVSTLQAMMRRVGKGEATVSNRPAPNTCNCFLDIVKGALTLAFEADLIQHNVARNCKLRRVQKAAKVYRTVSEQDYETILNHLVEQGQIADAALLGVWYNTGWRPHCAARDLKWSGVDFDALRVALDETKTDRQRDDRCEDVELEDAERATKIARLLVNSTDTDMYGVALPCEAFGVYLGQFMFVIAVMDRRGFSCVAVDGNGVFERLEKPPKHKLFKLLRVEPRAESTRKRLGKDLRELLLQAKS